MPLDLATAQPVNPPTVPDGKLAPLSAAGVKLTQWVLLILATVLVILLFAIAVQEWRVIDITSSAYARTLEKLKPSSLASSSRHRWKLPSLLRNLFKVQRQSQQNRQPGN